MVFAVSFVKDDAKILRLFHPRANPKTSQVDKAVFRDFIFLRTASTALLSARSEKISGQIASHHQSRFSAFPPCKTPLPSPQFCHFATTNRGWVLIGRWRNGWFGAATGGGRCWFALPICCHPVAHLLSMRWFGDTAKLRPALHQPLPALHTHCVAFVS